jgi:hypothetical protein
MEKECSLNGKLSLGDTSVKVTLKSYPFNNN